MTVQYSVQKMVSDGTLSTIALGIQYLQRNDIYMRIAGEETPQVGAHSGYTWSFINNTTLKILPVVPNGVEVVVYRRTDVDAMYNIYSQNAQFDEATIDENNQQLLYIAQEYLEQGIPGAGVDILEFVRDDGTYTYYRIKRTDGSYSDEFAVPSASSSTKVLAREALRRSYAEAGYNLVDGSFEAGGALVNANDVLLQERTGKAFSGPAGTVAAGTVPSGPNYINRGDETLRSALADPDSTVLVGGVEAGDVIKRLAYISLDEEFISGEADYTAAINRVFTKAKVLKLTPGVTYNYSATITIPSYCAIICDTQLNSAVLRKNHNGIGLMLSSYSQIKGVTHNQNNTTGTGVQVPSGFGQNIEKFKFSSGNGIGIQFLENAGGGSNLKEIEGTTNDIESYASIAFTKDTRPTPRFLNGIWLAGGSLDIRGSGNGCSLVNFYISRLVTGFDTVDGATLTGLIHISNGRIAGLGATRVYSMVDTDIVGVGIAEHIQLENCQGVKFIGGSATSYTENPTNCQYNELYTRTISYTPNWTQSSGVQPSYGDATVFGRWQRKGSTCSVYIEVTFGAATTYGNSAIGWNFSLPFNGALGVNQRGIPLKIVSGTTTYEVTGQVAENSNQLAVGFNGQSVRNGYPKVWAAGDRLEFHFEYFVR